MENKDYNCSFANMMCTNCNIGDEIQFVAQMRFLPFFDKRFNREKLSNYKPKEPTKVIMNGWYTRRPNKFLNTHKNFLPFITSMYIHPSCYKRFSKKDIKNFFIKHSPIGCRDYSTKRFLESIGVPAYFSSCLTLTLVPNSRIKKKDYILAMGLNDKQIDTIKQRTTHPVFVIDRLIPEIYSTSIRFNIAKAMLGLYQSAHCIVTNKMHVACPALALGTPVLLLNIDSNDKINDPERFEGITELFHNVDPEDLACGNFDYDFDNPPENPDTYTKYRDSLIESCSNFTGYNNLNTLINTDEPIGELLKFFTNPNFWGSQYSRPLYYISNWEILKILFKKVVLRKDAYRLS